MSPLVWLVICLAYYGVTRGDTTDLTDRIKGNGSRVSSNIITRWFFGTPQLGAGSPQKGHKQRVKRATTTVFTLSPAQKEALLQKHNDFRRAVDPPSSDMNRLLWHDTLQGITDTYAAMCIYAHNSGRTSSQSVFTNVGENIYAASAFTSVDAAISDSVTGWDAEKSDFEYSNNTCAPSKDCGHYTQVVWASTMFVGCSVVQCDTITNLPASYNNGVMVICDYGESGNFVGQSPYQEGTACTSCSASKCCDNGLCPDECPSTPSEALTTADTTTVGVTSVTVTSDEQTSAALINTETTNIIMTTTGEPVTTGVEVTSAEQMTSSVSEQNTNIATNSIGPTESAVPTTDAPIIASITTTDAPITIAYTATDAPIKTSITITDSPVTTSISKTDVQTTRDITTTDAQITTADISNGPITSGMTMTDPPITTVGTRISQPVTSSITNTDVQKTNIATGTPQPVIISSTVNLGLLTAITGTVGDVTSGAPSTSSTTSPSMTTDVEITTETAATTTTATTTTVTTTGPPAARQPTPPGAIALIILVVLFVYFSIVVSSFCICKCCLRNMSVAQYNRNIFPYPTRYPGKVFIP